MVPHPIRSQTFKVADKECLLCLASVSAQFLLGSYGLSLILRPFQSILSNLCGSRRRNTYTRIHGHRNDISLVRSEVYSDMHRDVDEIVFEDPLPYSGFVSLRNRAANANGCTIDSEKEQMHP